VKPEEFAREASFVMQGPVFGRVGDAPEARYTQAGLRSIRRYFPRAEVILSTWKECNRPEFLEGLDYDQVVFSDDPGSCVKDDVTRTRHNGNRLIVSSAAGLQAATRRYAVKMRSDMILLHDGMAALVGRYDRFDERYRLLRQRVLVSHVTTINPRRLVQLPHHVCDWFFCGLTEDLRNIFDIPLMPEPEWSRWYLSRPKPANDPNPTVLCRYMVEDYIWSSFVRKHRPIEHDYYCQISDAIVDDSERVIANNAVIATNQMLGIMAQKYPGIRAPHLLKCYTWLEWQTLYALHAGGPPVAGWDAELAINFSAHWLHRAVSPLFPLARPVVRAWRQLRCRMHASSASRF